MNSPLDTCTVVEWIDCIAVRRAGKCRIGAYAIHCTCLHSQVRPPTSKVWYKSGILDQTRQQARRARWPAWTLQSKVDIHVQEPSRTSCATDGRYRRRTR